MPSSVIRSVLAASVGASTEKAAQIVPPESLEYVAIKQEQQTRLLLRDTALYITIGGTLTAIAILSTANSERSTLLMIFLAYAAPTFSIAMFLIYFRNDYYISLARRYIVDELGPRILDNIALTTGATPEEDMLAHGFHWEAYHRRLRGVWVSLRIVSAFAIFSTFVSPIAISLFFLTSTRGLLSLTFGPLLASIAASLLISAGIIRLTFYD